MTRPWVMDSFGTADYYVYYDRASGTWFVERLADKACTLRETGWEGYERYKKFKRIWRRSYPEFNRRIANEYSGCFEKEVDHGQ